MFLGCLCERTLSFAVFPCGKRVRWSSSGRRPTDLPRAQSCQGPTDNVNAIFVNRPFQFNKRSQLFIGRTMKRFPSSRCASAIQIVRPHCEMRSACLSQTSIRIVPLADCNASAARHRASDRAAFCACSRQQAAVAGKI